MGPSAFVFLFLDDFIETLGRLRIFIENLVTKQFYAGKGRWTGKPDDAYAFPNAVAAMNFYMEEENRLTQGSLIMRFGTPKSQEGIKPTVQTPRLRSLISVY